MIKKRFLKATLLLMSFFCFISYRRKYFKYTKPVYIVNDQEWAMNGDVAQFSSVVYLKNEKITIETLSFINRYNSKANISCIFLFKNKFYLIKANRIVPVEVMKTYQGVSFIYKLIFYFDSIKDEKLNFDNLKLATINLNNYKKYDNYYSYLTFQRPTIFLNKKKQDQIVNCVHRVKNLNETLVSRLIIWLKIMVKLGYSKVVLYNNYIPSMYRKRIEELFPLFVEFVDYKTELKDCCNVARKKLESEPQNNFFHQEIINCVSNYHIFLNKYNESKVLVDQAVNRLGSNDCLMHKKFEFNYLTNFDFDEFILPRKFVTHLYRNINISTDSKMCKSFDNFAIKQNQTYNMIDYIEFLKKKFNSNIAHFTFENFQLLSNYKTIVDQLKTNSTKNYLFYRNSQTNLVFNFSKIEYVAKMRKLIYLTDCLNDTFIKLDPIFRNFVGSIINNRMGKSIFFTENTLAIHPHSSLLIKPETKKIKIPLTLGNVLHVRNSDTKISSKFTNNELNIDIEYLLFLKTLF